MSLSVAIVGAGILGRLIALRGHALGWRVTLFDKGDEGGRESCSYRPPAMLAPICERDISEPIIGTLGTESLKLWPEILRVVGGDVFFQQTGTLIVAHPNDRGEMARLKNSLTAKVGADSFRVVTGRDVVTLEPHLDPRFQDGLFVPSEGQVDSRGALRAIAEAIRTRGITCCYGAMASPTPKRVTVDGATHDFDMVIDARGYGAKDDATDLRAVRGEIIRLHAPDIHLQRPVRLLHPRHPIYVVPHGKGEYVIGATSIESEDDSPASVRSTLELLSAAFALNAGFGEARVIEMSVGLRPAFPDNLPRITDEFGLIRVNGLYRHGYLIAPKIAELVCDYVTTGQVSAGYKELFKKHRHCEEA